MLLHTLFVYNISTTTVVMEANLLFYLYRLQTELIIEQHLYCRYSIIFTFELILNYTPLCEPD